MPDHLKSTFHVPPLAAGESVVRDPAEVFLREADPYWTLLKVYNRSQGDISITLENGDRFIVGETAFIEIPEKVRWYALDTPHEVLAGQIEIFERQEEEDE